MKNTRMKAIHCKPCSHAAIKYTFSWPLLPTRCVVEAKPACQLQSVADVTSREHRTSWHELT